MLLSFPSNLQHELHNKTFVQGSKSRESGAMFLDDLQEQAQVCMLNLGHTIYYSLFIGNIEASAVKPPSKVEFEAITFHTARIPHMGYSYKYPKHGYSFNF